MTLLRFQPWRYQALRYHPWNTMAGLHREINQIFDDSFNASDGHDAPPADGESAATWVPAVDLHEEPDKFVIRADLPGVPSKDILVTAEKGVLTVRGERHAVQGEQSRSAARIERAHGAFLRRFTLPENVRTDDIRAQHANGVLEITLPKVPSPEPRRVDIETH